MDPQNPKLRQALRDGAVRAAELAAEAMGVEWPRESLEVGRSRPLKYFVAGALSCLMSGGLPYALRCPLRGYRTTSK